MLQKEFLRNRETQVFAQGGAGRPQEQHAAEAARGGERRRHDLVPEQQKVQGRSHKIQRIQEKRRYMQKENAAAQEEIRKIREEIDRNEERFRQLSDKVDKNKMVDAEMAAELQGLQAGGEKKGRDVSQTGGCCLEERLLLGTNRVEALFERVRREMGALPEQMPEGTVETNKSKAKPVSSWRCQRQPGWGA